MKQLDEYARVCVQEGPQLAMERMLLEEYLAQHGHCLAELDTLPQEKAQALMRAACRYASLRLAELESTAHLREKLRRLV